MLRYGRVADDVVTEVLRVQVQSYGRNMVGNVIVFASQMGIRDHQGASYLPGGLEGNYAP